MLINKAFATESAAAAADVGPWGAVFSQFALILVLVALFYVLLIMPQQRRFKEHKAMLDGLQKGDRIVTSGGLVGTVVSLSDDEAEIELSKGVNVTAMRNTIQQKVDKSKK